SALPRSRARSPRSAMSSTEVELKPPRSGGVKRALVGRPMASGEMEETLLPKWMALPIFASDPISSVAYATEAAMVVLVGVSVAALKDVLPISIGIAALLAIVGFSYTQTVRAYESSGGAYVVAKENLGTLPSLVAAAALLTDYVLTVAVSVAAGVFAITSFAPGLAQHEVALSLGCIGLIALANLRGVRESGLIFAVPTYSFVAAMFVLVGTGLARCAVGSCPIATVPHPLPVGAGAVTLFVVLRAFASGSTALTGVEAIANGVNAFRRPHGRNAATTPMALGAIAIAMFIAVSWLAVHVHARPTAPGTPSVPAEEARAVFPASPLSPAGMARYWRRTREPGWRHKIVINAVGSTATGVVTLVVIWTKFGEGAWIVTVAVPLLVLCFLGINRHYRRFARRLRA